MINDMEGNLSNFVAPSLVISDLISAKRERERKRAKPFSNVPFR